MLICSKCGTTDQSKFADSRRIRSFKSQSKIDHKQWCRECIKEYDKIKRHNLKSSVDWTKIIRCPKCGNSGDYSSGLFYKNRYILAKKTSVCKKCRKMDPKIKIRKNQAKRISECIKDQLGIKKKHQRTMTLIGCTPEELMKHLESQWTEGMSWDNYCYEGWHIDHIIPISSFDLNDEEQLKQCFHYSNLQPLWAEENLKKGSSK